MKSTFIILLVVTNIIGVYAEGLTFRGHSFNTTVDAFIAAEGMPNSQHSKDEKRMLGDIGLRYNGVSVAVYDADMEIEFDDEGLLAGVYSLLIEDSQGSNQYIDEFAEAYNDLSRRLISLYGDPIEHDPPEYSESGYSSWMQGTLRNNQYQSKWIVEDAEIWILLFYQEQWGMNIFYLSPRLSEQLRIAAQEAEMKTDGL